MDIDQSYRLLRMAFSLLRQKPTKQHKDLFDVNESVGRDLYDFVEQYTIDKTLKYQMAEAKKYYDTRLGVLRYLNHRLNIGCV